jgi:hypothetical protein
VLRFQRETNRDKPGTIEIRSSSAYLAPSPPFQGWREREIFESSDSFLGRHFLGPFFLFIPFILSCHARLFSSRLVFL